MKRTFSLLALVVALAALSVVAKADTLVFTTTLTGANEVPPTGSPATGTAMVTLNGNILTVSLTFTGLTGGPAAAAHIHCCAPAGTNTAVAVPFFGFPAATSGTYNQSFDLTLAATYSSGFLIASGGTAAGAEAALLAGLQGNQAYANIHNATFPGGEIRGQLAPVPEPVTMLLLATGLAGTVGVVRRRRRRPE